MTHTPDDAPVADLKPNTASFTLKGGLYPLTLFELTHFNKDTLRCDLENKVAEAPEFFKQVPVILSTQCYQGNPDEINLAQLSAICRDFGLIVVALRGGDSDLQQRAAELGMGWIAAGRKKKVVVKEVKAIAEELGNSVSVTGACNKIVSTPIRSGQQVYAPGGDLIVMAPVSAGAEVLADGNIHIYGPVRGRILAGVKGDTSARVFCQSLEAELISIAGHFTTEEDAHSQYWKKAVQIHLSGEALQIEPLFTQPR